MDCLDVLPPEMEKVVRTAGNPGRKPVLGCKCFVRLEPSGEVSPELTEKSDYLKNRTSEITIGNGDWDVDKAIESCLTTMNVKEDSSFRLRVGDGLSVNLSIALDDWEQRDYIFRWTDEDKLETSKFYKADGVELFRNNRIEHAFYKFSKAVKMLLLMDSDASDPELGDVFVSLYNNLANCQFRFRNYSHVIELCNKSLSIKPNVKGYFRRSMAYVEIKEYENAENDILQLLKIEPKNRAAIEKYKLIRSLDKTNRENYEAIVKNMFR